MRGARQIVGVALAAAALALTGCAIAPPATTAPTPAAGPTASAAVASPASATPAASASPAAIAPPISSAVPTVVAGHAPPDWERFETLDGSASIAVPPGWTAQAVSAGDSAHPEPTEHTVTALHAPDLPSVLLTTSAERSDDEPCGPFGFADGGEIPVRVHAVERLDLGLPQQPGPAGGPVLMTATLQFGEHYLFHAGLHAAPPVGDTLPCDWYRPVETLPDGQLILLGTPLLDYTGEWEVDSFEDGAARAASPEHALVMDVMRSVRLHP